MQVLYRGLTGILAGAVLSLAACESMPTGIYRYAFQSNFDTGATDGWVVEFADYPADNEEVMELQSGIRPLPAPLDTTRTGLFVSGHNRSDDLFMYLKRPVDGLIPGERYRVRFEIEFATNAGSGCAGIGGAPGESVYVKAGASRSEPVRIVESDGWYRLSIDKGNQSAGGESVAVVDDVANGSADCSADAPYVLKRVDSAFDSTRPSQPANSIVATADASGRLWLLVGTDSGFEGLTSLYYTAIRAELERIR